MEKQGRERRKHKRIPLNLEIKVHILHPEDTISTESFTARISNISERDARITVFDLPPKYYQKLIKDRDLRFIRLFCKFPTSEDETKLLGRILYFDYYGKDEVKLCEIVLQFWELEEEQQRRLKDFLGFLKQHPLA